MMISATACAGTVELSVCSDTASIADNRLTISAPPPPPSNALGQRLKRVTHVLDKAAPE